MSTDNSSEYIDQSGEQTGGDATGPELIESMSAGGGTEESLIVADEKQPVNRSTLVMFAILVLAASGLYFMYRRTGPQGAMAASITKETAEARKTISNFLSGGDASFKSMEMRLKYTEKVVQQFRKYPSATQVPLNDLLTNPFRLHAPEAKKQNVSNEGLSEAAEKKRRDEERVAIRKAVEGLQLQSIMCGDTRKACMINNTLYREGQTVENFTIEKISPSTVEVKNGPYRFQLRMDR
jgi:hypothetical protein